MVLMAGLGGFVFSMYLFTPITTNGDGRSYCFHRQLEGFRSSCDGPHRNINAGRNSKRTAEVASGVFNLTRNLGGAIGIALVALFSIIELIFIFREWVKKCFCSPYGE